MADYDPAETKEGRCAITIQQLLFQARHRGRRSSEAKATFSLMYKPPGLLSEVISDFLQLQPRSHQDSSQSKSDDRAHSDYELIVAMVQRYF